ncbi:hypothetical protein GT021_02880, partial [Streptomyces sp. SID5470]|nr:hypothetical protein [Streptomyces sp. SID5470]
MTDDDRRAGTAGTWTTRLSQGRTVTTRTPAVPAPITPARWELDVEDWYPGLADRLHPVVDLGSCLRRGANT